MPLSSIFILGDGTIYPPNGFAVGCTFPVILRIWDRPTSAGSTEGSPLTKAQIASIAIVVLDKWSDENTLSTTIDKEVAIKDTLEAWNVDATGHNFRYNVPASAFPSAGHPYRVTITWTLADGRVGKTKWEGVAQ